MKKLIIAITGLLLSTNSFADAQTKADIINIVKAHDYIELKNELYNSDINVLDRSGGYSVLDYAMNIGDKRAAIIIADYNNSSISERKIIKLKNSIKVLETEITKTNTILEKSDSGERIILENKLKEMALTKNKMEQEINKVQNKVSTSSDNAQNEKIEKLERDVKFLMSNFINADQIKKDFDEKIKSSAGLTITSSKECN